MSTKAKKHATPPGAADLRPVQPKWRRLIVVCGKCASKRGDDRKAKATRSALKRGAKEAGCGGTRVAEVGCLGVCPKDGVTACALDPVAGANGVSVLKPGFDAQAVVRAWFPADN
ncbi:hypothetical protein [Marinivivus vitaminiproducens]|uniref:hypothetical protein n=1 Tax=Marinivivus vitaminiproducens TaxID=3035935 RepID=UPI0027996D73|nr:hypothetical protein P4R82_19025 [Geminicoccaceae bacterium SCSIO 64248]